MAGIKFEEIISCSSEDPEYPSSNLLKDDDTPWKTGKEGENQATVILKLDQMYTIGQIEIRNECSAFVEILVSNQEDGQEPKFQVLLSASSFMTPNESKNQLNPNRVRVFTKDKLSPSALKYTFNLVKINCTQPFNKTIKFGLSRIRLIEAETRNDTESSGFNTIKLGGFRLRSEDDKANSTPTIGGFFNKDKASKDETLIIPPKRSKDEVAKDEDKSQPKANVIKPDGDDNSSMDVDPPSQSVTATNSQNKPDPLARGKPKTGRASQDLNQPSTSAKTKNSTRGTERRTRTKTKANSTTTKKTSTKANVPFDKLMHGVTFVISGFQNPLRSEIRSKGLQMGARYKQDWGSDCTHLICAFPNTPKYNQVLRTDGKIVKKEWIEDSYNQRKLLPWKKYSLVPSNNDDDEEGEENEDEEDDLDGFIVSDDDEDDEYVPGKYEEASDEDEEEELEELGPVLPTRLRTPSPPSQRANTSKASPKANKPEPQTQDVVEDENSNTNSPAKPRQSLLEKTSPRKASSSSDHVEKQSKTIKDEKINKDDYDSDALYDASTDDEG